MRLLTLAGLFAMALASAAAAGPWPRGEGKVFVSVAYEGLVDLDLLPLYVIGQGGTAYAEYGIGPRTTLGLDLYSNLEDERTVIAFARRTLTSSDRRNQFAVTLGYGTRQAGGRSTSLAMLGASWGRGFSSRWGDGWMTADAQLRYRMTGDTLVKLDATLGVKPRPDWMLIGQLQLSETTGSRATARIKATAVHRLNDRLSLEAGVLYGIMNDTRAGLTLGLWTEF